ncbi:hypothetical protein QZH41_008662, partial [Actinostola sp. cb2023]
MANKKEEPEDSETSSSEKKSANSVLTKQEKLQQAIVLKDEGNAFYKQNDFKNAMKKYHHALLFVKGLAVEQPFKHILFYDNGEGEVTEEFKQKAQHTESICYNNLAACHIAGSRWPKVVDYCSKVLAYQTNNAKALFRRGQAYMNLNDIDRAREDLIKAHELEPT